MQFIARKYFVGAFAAVVCMIPATARAQGPSPETGATMFPGGASVSYGSTFETRDPLAPGNGPTVRPTFSHTGLFIFSWGFRRDYQLLVLASVQTTRRRPFGVEPERGTTNFGDLIVAVKHRVLRLDSQRGTTQLSLAAGVKLPTGPTGARDTNGALLPVGLQAGSGSTDAYFNVSATYTGLFNIRRLVADESFTYLARTEGSQQMRVGDALESRTWLSYRPYQAQNLTREWFIGPLLLWRRNHRSRLSGVRLGQSGGDMLALGVTTYVGVRPGVHLWFEADFPVWQTRRGAQTQLESRYSFGITRQFRFPFHR